MLGMKTVAISAVLGATAAGLLASSAAYAFVAPSPTAGAAVEATVDRRQRGAFTSTFPQLVPCYRRPRARSGSLSMMVSPSTGSTPGSNGSSKTPSFRGASRNRRASRRSRLGAPSAGISRPSSSTPPLREDPHGSVDDYRYVAAITEGVPGFLDAMDQSLSGELVTVMTHMPWCRSCHHLRHRLRLLAEAHALAGSGAMFYEIDLNSNPEVHKMLDIHAVPTVLLYSSGQLVDEFTCPGTSGPKILLRHIEDQVGSVPDPWHRLHSVPVPSSPTPGTEEDSPGVEK